MIFSSRNPSLSISNLWNRENLDAAIQALTSHSPRAPKQSNHRNFEQNTDNLSSAVTSESRNHINSFSNEQIDSGVPSTTTPSNPVRTIVISDIVRYNPSSLLFQEITDPFETDENLKLMDKLYNANFHGFIRNEENVLVTSRHLIHIAGDYEITIVSNALKWIMNDWKLENVAKLVKLVSREWCIEARGLVLNLITVSLQAYSEGDHLNEEDRVVRVKFQENNSKNIENIAIAKDVSDMSNSSKTALMKLVAIMIAGDPPAKAAKFIYHLTRTDSWNVEKTTEMISFLDSILEWDKDHFRQFTQTYLGIFRQRPQDNITGKISFQYLAALYRKNLAMTNYRLALADYNLALATRKNIVLSRRLQSTNSATSESMESEIPRIFPACRIFLMRDFNAGESSLNSRDDCGSLPGIRVSSNEQSNSLCRANDEPNGFSEGSSVRVIQTENSPLSESVFLQLFELPLENIDRSEECE